MTEDEIVGHLTQHPELFARIIQRLPTELARGGVSEPTALARMVRSEPAAFATAIGSEPAVMRALTDRHADALFAQSPERFMDLARAFPNRGG